MIWLLIYVAALLISAFVHAGRNSIEKYFVFGRKAGAGLVCFSLLASCIGGSATIGMLGLAWEIGFPAFWWLGSGVAGLLALGIFLSEKVRRSQAWTMPQILSSSLGDSFRKLSALIIFMAYLAIMSAQFGALQLIIESLTGIAPSLALPLGIIILFTYTCLGGQSAVIKSDVWQFGIIVIMLLALLLFCVNQEGSRTALLNMRWELFNRNFPPSRMIYFLLILGGSFLVGPMLFGRLLSAKNPASARYGTFGAAFGLFLLALVITLVGVGLRGFTLPANVPSQEIFGIFVREFLPDWAHVPILLGMLSVVVSSADSCLLTVATVCANDLVQKPSLWLCRLFMMIVCVLAYCLSLLDKGILKLLLMANDVYVCGLVIPTFTGIMVSGKLPIDRRLVLCAMIGGGGTGFCAALLSWQWLGFISLGIALVFSLLAIVPRNYLHKLGSLLR